MFLAFSASLIMILVKKLNYRIISFVLLAIVGYMIRNYDLSQVIFTIFLPTLSFMCSSLPEPSSWWVH